MDDKSFEISVSRLQEEIETMSLAERFFGLESKGEKNLFPVVERGRQPLLAVFWKQAAMQLAMALSAWCHTQIRNSDEAGDALPEKITVELPLADDSLKLRVRSLSESYLRHWVLARAAACASRCDVAERADSLAQDALHSLRSLFLTME